MESPNLKYIKELSGGDLTFEKNLLDIIKKEFPEEVTEFNLNFKNKSYIEASNNVHKIKHKFSILGLNKDLELATKFENQLKKEDIKLYSKFVNILNKIHVYLKNN